MEFMQALKINYQLIVIFFKQKASYSYSKNNEFLIIINRKHKSIIENNIKLQIQSSFPIDI
jgi:hypothetical protein